MEAVRTWRFKPAVGPDKKPTAISQLIECDSHLYWAMSVCASVIQVPGGGSASVFFMVCPSTIS